MCGDSSNLTSQVAGVPRIQLQVFSPSSRKRDGPLRLEGSKERSRHRLAVTHSQDDRSFCNASTRLRRREETTLVHDHAADRAHGKSEMSTTPIDRQRNFATECSVFASEIRSSRLILPQESQSYSRTDASSDEARSTTLTGRVMLLRNDRPECVRRMQGAAATSR